jgi:hypothetical protein
METVQIPLLSGIGTTELADFQQVYPINLEPVGLDSGISKGYLRSAMGATQIGTGPGIDRGGILYAGFCHRVMGTKLVKIDTAGNVTVLGDVGSSGPVSLDYGFDRLAIRSGTNLYYWNGTTLSQVTDPDLGRCLDVVWIAGYFVSTDGVSIVVTDLSDPTSVNPLKYGSAEADPDMVTGLLHYRDELLAFGTYTIEFFANVGGSGFPFQANTGATIPIGCVGPQAKCIYGQNFAWTGGGRNQAISVWQSQGSSTQKLSTRAIDDILATVVDQSSIRMESRISRDEQRLYVHLPDQTLVYLANASEQAGKPVWYVAASGEGFDEPYRIRNAVLMNGVWIVGDTQTSAVGIIDENVATHFGEMTGWQFQTQMVFNQSNSFIIHSMELVGLPGRHQTVPEPAAFLSSSVDGQTWSQEKTNTIGKPGQRRKRIVWNIHRRGRNYMTIRFRGDSHSLTGFAALQTDLEMLSA